MLQRQIGRTPSKGFARSTSKGSSRSALKGSPRILLQSSNSDAEDSYSSSSDSEDELQGRCTRLKNSPAMRCLALVLLWLLAGMYFLHDKYPQPVDRLYFLVQTLTTVGYGDLEGPVDTDEGYLFFALYALSSTLLIGHILGVFIAYMTAGNENAENDNSLPAQAGHDTRLHRFLKALLLWLFFVVTWAVFFWVHPNEPAGFEEAIYMAVITLTTIGYGDSTPETDSGKIFATAWMLGGTYAFTDLMGKFSLWSYFFFHHMSVEKLDGNSLSRMRSHYHFERVVVDRARDLEKILTDFESAKNDTSLQSEYTSRIGRNDFVVFSLVDMGLVGEDMLETLNQHFDELDVTGDGFIELDDLVQAKKMQHEARVRSRSGSA